MTALLHSTRQERQLIKIEEKAEARFLKAGQKHEKAARTLEAATERLERAELRLQTAQQARAAGPADNEKPADV